MPRGGMPRRARCASFVTAAGMAAISAVLAAGASAQVERLRDPGATTGLDTSYTPTARTPPKGMLHQVAGARFNSDRASPNSEDLVAGSVTGPEVDLFTVSFRDASRGYAGGTVKRTDGTHEPILYSFREDVGWRRVPIPAGHKGFVAAIAWLDDERALAVGGDGSGPGGDGSYPRREQSSPLLHPCAGGEEPPADPSGSARAWIVEDAGAEELENRPDGTAGDQIPDGMTALSALDVYRAPPGEQVEFGIAGGMCQVWHWVDGRFSGKAPVQVRSRVRSVRFTDLQVGRPESERIAEAWVAGTGRELFRFQPTTLPAGTWAVVEPAHPSCTRVQVISGNKIGAPVCPATSPPPDGFVSVNATRFVRRNAASELTELAGPTVIESPMGPAAPAELPSRVGGRSTGYSSLRLAAGDGDIGGAESGLKSGFYGTGPGWSSYTPNSFGSGLIEIGVGDWGGLYGPGGLAVGGVELDGKVGGDRKMDPRLGPYAPDGIPDWSVGTMTASGRGALYGTDPAQLPPPEPATKPLPRSPASTAYPPEQAGCIGSEGYNSPGNSYTNPIDKRAENEGGCALSRGAQYPGEFSEYALDQPTGSDRLARAIGSHRLLAAPSYGLNSIDYLDSEGVAWLVGDHGAIVRLTVDRPAVARNQEPPPPELGKPESAALADPDEWGVSKPAGSAGEVPTQSSQPVERQAEPEMQLWDLAAGDGRVQDGAPKKILISPAGDEGWALTKKGYLIHFNGRSWTFCDPEHRRFAISQDPLCDEALSLLDGAGAIRELVRVPLENDNDPSNDSDFETAAITEASGGSLIWYRDGSWDLDSRISIPGSNTIRSVAFVSPHEGWVLRAGGSRSPGYRGFALLRLVDGVWTTCTPAKGEDICDPNDRLPISWEQGEVEDLAVAGNRLYALGFRFVGRDPTTGGTATSSYPLIVYREAGAAEWHRDLVTGEYDPALAYSRGGAPPNPDLRERIDSFSVAALPGGAYEGWANRSSLRLVAGGGWRKFTDSGALADYAGGSTWSGGPKAHHSHSGQIAVVPKPDGGSAAYVGEQSGRIFAFDPKQERWSLLRAERPLFHSWYAELRGSVVALADDRAAGIWAAVADDTGVYFYRYTDRPFKPVFQEVPLPSSEPRRVLRSLSSAADGTVWAASNSSVLFRYDRRLGWDRVDIPGWQRGRVQTRPAAATAISVNAAGMGFVVGEGGRIAQVGRRSVQLDPAAGKQCDASHARGECGTTRDLRSIDVADDGSAVAGGDAGTLLWRPPGGGFRPIPPPPLPSTESLGAVAAAGAGRIWVASTTGELFAGRRTEAGWRWSREYAGGRALLAIGVDADGWGYAAGAGVVLERRGGEWTEVDVEARADFDSVALTPGGGPGAMIVSKRRGIVLTRVNGLLTTARESDFPYDGRDREHPVERSGAALAPGAEGGIEAWVLIDRDRAGSARLLHYRPASGKPSPSASEVVRPLPDAPAPRPGEIAFPAFGKSDCLSRARHPCQDMLGSTDFAEVVLHRIGLDLIKRNSGGEFAFALATGDITDNPGYPGNDAFEPRSGDKMGTDQTELWHTDTVDSAAASVGTRFGPRKVKRWGELVADRLTNRGLPLFAAIGAQDLSGGKACRGGASACQSYKQYVAGGENMGWRQAMARRQSPWGGGIQAASQSGFRARPVSRRFGAVPLQNRTVDADGDGVIRPVEARIGGASTHYAVDLIPSRGSNRHGSARLIVADSSLGSLAAGDAVQNPVEASGQMAWLERMLCIADGAANGGQGCTRRPGQAAIVVSNAPTYTYGPGSRSVAADSAALEAILLRHRASVLISGKLGWNGMYWTVAPGVHYPCPGEGYPEDAPSSSSWGCGAAVNTTPSPVRQAETLAPILQSGKVAGGDVIAPDRDLSGTDSIVGALPSVVASGVGALASENGTASDGFWHGYSVVRLDPSGDPLKTIVEQRPVYDWIGIEAAARALRPGQRMTLRGYGRSPIGNDLGGRSGENAPYSKTDRIDGPAVTHRYDLVAADLNRPWLPKTDGDGEYVLLDPSIATVDSQTGEVRAGRGNHPRAFAVGMLSLGCSAASSRDCEPGHAGHHVATYPLIFEPRRTFLPPSTGRQGHAAAVVVQSAAAGISPPGSPSTPPQVGSLSPAALPSLPPSSPPPATPPIGSPQPATPVPPPAMTAPATPLDLATAPPGLTVAPPASVIPPPAPPINPAPPGGARREARQRQAATEKSGTESGSSVQEELGTVDLSDQPPGSPGANMSRRDRVKAEPSFTALARPGQGSAWLQGLYGGGLTVAAAALAGLWTTRPRPRPPAVPATARAEIGRYPRRR